MRYESAKGDPQQVSLFVTRQVDRGVEVSLTVDVRCSKKVDDAARTTKTRVGADGHLDVKMPVSGKDGDDSFTDGTAHFEGDVTPDGGIAGTVDVQLLEYDQMDRDAVRGKCSTKNAKWQAQPGPPDPGLSRLEAVVPLPRATVGDDWVAGIGASDDAVYLGTSADVGQAPHSVVRVDPETGKRVWRQPAKGEVHTIVPAGGAVWVASNGRRLGTGDVVRLDAKTGEQTAALRGNRVAVGPDGSVWIGQDGGREIRRVDPSDGHDLRTYEVPEQTGTQNPIAAGSAGVYAAVLTEEPFPRFERLARLDPATGAVTVSTGGPAGQGGTSSLVADGSTVWDLSSSGVLGFDAVTLAPTGKNEDDAYPAFGGATAPSGLWVGDYHAILVVDRTGQIVSTVTGFSGPVTATASKVWVYDHVAGLVRFSAV